MTLKWSYENFNTFDSTINSNLMQTLEDVFPIFVGKTTGSNDPIFSLPAKKIDFPEIEQHAKRISAISTDVIMLGVGGSSLGGQALIQSCRNHNKKQPNIIFTDNLSPHGFPQLLNELNPSNTHIVAISKSGNTMELHVQLALIMEWLSNSNSQFKDHITVITETNISPLKKLIQLYDLPYLDHLISLDGRFSILSNVGLLPAAIAGINIREIRRGAQEVVEEMIASKHPREIPSAVGAAHIISQQQQNNINISVLFLYSDRLRKFGEWYCQLWAESLGKKGGGTAPIIAQGPLDQHSQLQLYMEGPRDKSYSFITTARSESEKITIPKIHQDIDLDILSNLTLHDISRAMSEGTHHALVETGQPVRHTHIEDINETNIGRLIMLYFLETMFASALLDVNPFGQPGVERGKNITREFLKKLKSKK